jgi:hypothetical protein
MLPVPIEERKRIPAKRMKASPSKSIPRATEVMFKHVCDPPSFPAVLPTLRTDLKGMRELVTKYGDHMQTHLVDAIRGGPRFSCPTTINGPMQWGPR